MNPYQKLKEENESLKRWLNEKSELIEIQESEIRSTERQIARLQAMLGSTQEQSKVIIGAAIRQYGENGKLRLDDIHTASVSTFTTVVAYRDEAARQTVISVLG